MFYLISSYASRVIGKTCVTILPTAGNEKTQAQAPGYLYLIIL
jgi:hypothetical protein